MVKVVMLIAVCAFLVTGCAGVEVYTFKKQRVDQDLYGNEGYLEGKPPAEEKYRNPKRTLIGIDIDLDMASSSTGTQSAAVSAGEDIGGEADESGAAAARSATAGHETETRKLSQHEEDYIK